MKIEISEQQRERVERSINQHGYAVLRKKGGGHEVCNIHDLDITIDLGATNFFGEINTNVNGTSRHETVSLKSYIEKLGTRTFWQKLMFWRSV